MKIIGSMHKIYVNNENATANALLSLGHIVRIHRKLEKHIVNPILLWELKYNTSSLYGNIISAVDDINFLMGWNLLNNNKFSVK